MYKIKQATISSVIEASSNLYPDEFFCLLGGDKKEKVIDEFIVVPAEYLRDSVSINTWLMPIDPRVVGSVHSHPHKSPPSITDLQNFAKFGEIHLITFPPFSSESFLAFGTKGKRLEIRVVD